MQIISAIMAVFALIGAVDRILNNRLGLGKEFEKGFMLYGQLAMAMVGMIVLSPVIANILRPAAMWVYEALHIDPSLITSLIVVNDMGGAALAQELAVDPLMGRFNGLVVSCMMGATISFTIPYGLENVKPHQHNTLLLGMLCGVATIPVGCFAGGLVLGVPMDALLLDLLPLILFAALIAVGLVLFPAACARVFAVIGAGIRILITIGLILSVITFLSGVEILPGLGKLEDAALVCLNCSAFLCGVFPMMAILSRVLDKPLRRFSRVMGVNETSALGLLACLATSMGVCEMMERMDDKGALVNSAFMISAAFVFADHLAFTMAFDASCVPAVTVGKLVAGVLAIIVANVLYIPMKKRLGSSAAA